MHLLQNQEMPSALQLCQIDICNTANFDIVQCKRSFHVYYTCALLKVSSTRIGCSFVHSDTQVGSTSGLGELNKEEQDLGMDRNHRLGCQCVILKGIVKVTF